MITGIFLLSSDSFVCSNHVDMDFKGDVKRQTVFVAKNYYASGELPQVNDILDCVIKYEVGKAMNCKVCLRSIEEKKIVVSLSTPFQSDGTKQLLSRIACLV